MHGELLKNPRGPRAAQRSEHGWGEEEHMKWALRYFKFEHITEIMPAHAMSDDDVHHSSQRDNFYHYKNASVFGSVLFLLLCIFAQRKSTLRRDEGCLCI